MYKLVSHDVIDTLVRNHMANLCNYSPWGIFPIHSYRRDPERTVSRGTARPFPSEAVIRQVCWLLAENLRVAAGTTRRGYPVAVRPPDRSLCN